MSEDIEENPRRTIEEFEGTVPKTTMIRDDPATMSEDLATTGDETAMTDGGLVVAIMTMSDDLLTTRMNADSRESDLMKMKTEQ